MVRRLLLSSSSSILFFFFVFCSPKPGLRGGDKSLLFSVAKKGLQEVFSRIYRPGEKDERGEEREKPDRDRMEKSKNKGESKSSPSQDGVQSITQDRRRYCVIKDSVSTAEKL